MLGGYGADLYNLARLLGESYMINAVIHALRRVGRKGRGVGIILDEGNSKKLEIIVEEIQVISM